MAEGRSAVRRWWWLVVAGLLLGAGAGFVVGQQVSRLESTSELLILGASGADPTLDSALEGNQYVNARMPTYAALAATDSVTDRAAVALSLPEGSLAGAVTAVAAPDTTLLEISVTGLTPQDAADRCAAITAALQATIGETENIAGQPVRVQLAVVSAASLPDAAPLPRGVIAIIGAVLGLVLGVLAMLGAARNDRTSRHGTAYDSSRTTLNPALPNGRPLPPRAPRRPAAPGADVTGGPAGRERP